MLNADEREVLALQAVDALTVALYAVSQDVPGLRAMSSSTRDAIVRGFQTSSALCGRLARE